jgi:hypothetical protein
MLVEIPHLRYVVAAALGLRGPHSASVSQSWKTGSACRCLCGRPEASNWHWCATIDVQYDIGDFLTVPVRATSFFPVEPFAWA